MKVAVASQDGVSISNHFGWSGYFIVFDVDAGLILGSDVRENTAAARHQCSCETRRCPNNEGDSHIYREMLVVLDGCRVVLCRGMGWRAAEVLVRGGVNPMVIQGDLTPRQAVQQYLDGGLVPAAGFCRPTGRSTGP